MKLIKGRKVALDSKAALLLYQPRTYLDNSTPLESIRELSETVASVIRLRVTNSQVIAGARKRLQLDFVDARGARIDASIFGDFRRWNDLEPGDTILVRAKRGEFNGYAQLRGAARVAGGLGVEPVYSPAVVPDKKEGRKRVTGETVARQIKAALHKHLEEAVEIIVDACELRAPEIARLIGVTSLGQWILTVHAPASIEQARAARQAARRLVVLEAVVAARENASRPKHPRSRIAVSAQAAREMIAASGITPTGAQARVVEQLCASLASDTALRAMVTGDVGSGKSLAFAVPAALAARAGAVVAVLVPREILIAKTAKDFLQVAPNVEVVEHYEGGKLTKPVAGAILIGTHALNRAMAKAGIEPKLVVTDEQHVSGRQQREASVKPHTNLIEVSATPIPRSMALLQTGGMELLVLDETPFKRRVETVLLEPTQKDRLWEFVRRIAEHPTKQVAIVYPSVSGSESQADKAKITGTAATWERRFPGKVAVLHGGLSRQESAAALARVSSGEAKVLVATTVIELGVTLPDLAAMVVVEPHRFGLSALHQLRGRLVRHGGVGRMLLYPLEPLADPVVERLMKLVQISDGFRLAEEDLALRGGGDLSSESQDQNGDCRGVLPNLLLGPRDLLALEAFVQKVRGHLDGRPQMRQVA